MITVIVQNAAITCIYALLALSLNLQYGLTGLLNFGQIFFYAIGGYCIGVVYYHHWPVWIGLLAAPLIGAVGGVLLALPTLRLNADFWALMTLGAAELFVAIVNNVDGIAGGPLGSYGIPSVSNKWLIPLLLGTIVVVYLAFERIRRSQFGRVIRVVRDDPVLVAALGRSAFAFRTAVLAVSGAVASIAGAALAFWLTIIAPSVFTLDQTVLVWTAMVIGGCANNLGAIVGAIVLEIILVGTPLLPGFGSVISLGDSALVQLMIEGVLLVVVLTFRRQGLIPERKVRHARS